VRCAAGTNTSLSMPRPFQQLHLIGCMHEDALSVQGTVHTQSPTSMLLTHDAE
jgi:hypothetical protein